MSIPDGLKVGESYTAGGSGESNSSQKTTSSSKNSSTTNTATTTVATMERNVNFPTSKVLLTYFVWKFINVENAYEINVVWMWLKIDKKIQSKKYNVELRTRGKIWEKFKSSFWKRWRQHDSKQPKRWAAKKFNWAASKGR